MTELNETHEAKQKRNKRVARVKGKWHMCETVNKLREKENRHTNKHNRQRLQLV